MWSFLRKNILYVILSIAFLLYLFSMNLIDVGSLNDDAAYIISAKSLLVGKAFRTISDPEEPPSNYPIGFPLILAPFVALCYPDIWYLKLLMIPFTIAAMYMVYRYFRSICSETQALSLLMMTAFNPHIVCFSGAVMSEIPYMFFSFLTLSLMQEKENSTQWGFWKTAIIAISSSFCMWLRAIGTSLFISIVIFLGTRKSFSRILIMVIIFSLSTLPIFYFTSTFSHYQGDVKPLRGPSAGMLLSLLDMFCSNMIFYMNENMSLAQLHPAVQELNFYWKLPFLLVLIAGILYGLYSAEKERREAILIIYCLVYMAIVCLWPYYANRFLIPIIPVLYYFLLVGLQKFAEKLKIQYSHIILVLIFIALHIYPDYRIIAYSSRRAFTQVKFPGVYQWLKAHAKSDDIVLSDHSLYIYIFTGLKGLMYPAERHSYNMIMQVYKNRAKYLVFNPDLSSPSRLGSPIPVSVTYLTMVKDNPRKFVKVYEDTENDVFVYQTQGDGLTFVQAYGYLMEGNRLFLEKQYDQAISKLDQALNLEPDLLEAFNLKGIVYLEKGDIQGSMLEFKKLLCRNPNHMEGHFNLGRAYLATGDKDTARRELQWALDIAEKNQNLEIQHVIKGFLEQAAEGKK